MEEPELAIVKCEPNDCIKEEEEEQRLPVQSNPELALVKCEPYDCVKEEEEEQEQRVLEPSNDCVADTEFVSVKCEIENESQDGDHTHNEKLFYCFRCRADFSSNDELQQHMLEHDTLNLHTCDFCNKQYKCKSSLKYHMQQHTDKKQERCEICGLQFWRKFELSRHIATIHARVRPYW